MSMVKQVLRPVVRPARRAVNRYRTRDERARDEQDNRHLSLLLSLGLRSDSNCVDVGANQGDVLERIVEAAPAGRHVAFEPIPALAADLGRRFPQVEVHPCAVAAAGGEASFVHVMDRQAYSGLVERDHPPSRTQTLTVRVETLDDVLDGRRVDFVKVDVEGGEFGVIQGGLQVLKDCQPTVVFEHGTAAAAYGTDSRTLYRLLRDEAAMRVFDIDGCELDEDGFVSSRVWTFVARP